MAAKFMPIKPSKSSAKALMYVQREDDCSQPDVPEVLKFIIIMVVALKRIIIDAKNTISRHSNSPLAMVLKWVKKLKEAIKSMRDCEENPLKTDNTTSRPLKKKIRLAKTDKTNAMT